MFKNIDLQNFKGFKNSKIEIKELTILTGANSSGKSALTNSILSILQSNVLDLELSINGKYVNLGDYNDVINNRDGTKELSYRFEIVAFGIVFKITTTWNQDKLRKLPKIKKLEIDSDAILVRINGETRNRYSVEIDYNPKFDRLLSLDQDDTIRTHLEAAKNAILRPIVNGESFNMELFSQKINKKWSWKGSININKNFSIPFSFTDKIPYQVFRILSLPAFELQNIKNDISFIGSLRQGPERTYYETSKSDIGIGPSGENLSDLIVLWQNRKDDKLKELIKITSELNIANDIKASRIAGGRYEIQVMPRINSPYSSLNDVGFGLSQFLPIIASDIEKGKGSTLFIAQPETHLHPSIQADFCNYLIEQITNQKKNYFIETHSEYFLNRLRLNIVNNKISTEKVKVYYLINKGEDTEIHEIKFLKDGTIANAPEEFFQTYLMDTMDIALNAINNEE